MRQHLGCSVLRILCRHNSFYGDIGETAKLPHTLCPDVSRRSSAVEVVPRKQNAIAVDIAIQPDHVEVAVFVDSWGFVQCQPWSITT